MRLMPALGAAALALTATAALAQTTTPSGATAPSSSAAPTTAPPTGAAPSASASATATAAIAPGLSVKDKTGATIGTVTDVKKDASGADVATIKMGADSFAVNTSALAVENGSAMVNATQAEIRQMMAGAKKR